MMFKKLAFIGVLVLVSLLGGCQDDVKTPDPMELTRTAIGHYCNMIVVDHKGPKAQVFENGQSEPLWFTSVRDAIVYMTLPGEAQNVTAIYVHDMSQATNWDTPQNHGIWIEATKAFYVIESSKRGGMGAKETVPFETREQASKFIATFAGRVVTYKDIPRSYILGGDHDKPGRHRGSGAKL